MAGKYASSNRELVESLYDSLACGDTAAATVLLAEDVDWWFHGPRRCQHMRRLLTGEAGPAAFRFTPARVTEVGGWVVAEGWEGEQAYWVHAWLLDARAGVITGCREYFNTSVTVWEMGWAVWQSQPTGTKARSMPALVLTI